MGATRSRINTGRRNPANRPHVPVHWDVPRLPRQSQPRGHGVEAELRAWVGPCVEWGWGSVPEGLGQPDRLDWPLAYLRRQLTEKNSP